MELTTGALHLKSGRAKPIRNRHPWLFSGAIRRISGNPAPGDLVDIVANDGTWLAVGYYNPRSQIRARVLSWGEGQSIDSNWWHGQIQKALEVRNVLHLEPRTTAFRLVNAEADGIPGLVVDRYGDYLSVQCLTLGIDRRKELLVKLLNSALEPVGIVERSDVDVRKQEGLQKEVGILVGKEPPDEYVVSENGLLFAADLLQGQKTGLYLDQRENRALVGQKRFVAGKVILNAFAYTGGFGVYAAAAGANSVLHVDSSPQALSLASKNLDLNANLGSENKFLVGDVFKVLRELLDDKESFDLIVLDPPKFARRRQDVPSACRGYKDLNLLAFRLLSPGGILATFSCSGLVDADLFQKVVFGAAVDAGRDAQILYHMRQAPDHPILLTFPESLYLKGLLARAV